MDQAGRNKLSLIIDDRQTVSTWYKGQPCPLITSLETMNENFNDFFLEKSKPLGMNSGKCSQPFNAISGSDFGSRI